MAFLSALRRKAEPRCCLPQSGASALVSAMQAGSAGMRRENTRGSCGAPGLAPGFWHATSQAGRVCQLGDGMAEAVCQTAGRRASQQPAHYG